ncbi:hypothetical protein [Methanopyrus sp.]|jgi:transcription elongation factor Elf1
MRCRKCGSSRVVERKEGKYVVVRCKDCDHAVVLRRVETVGTTHDVLSLAIAAVVTAGAIASVLM